MSAALMHERTEDGRERHFMNRLGDFWVCECGATQDKYGRLIETPAFLSRPLLVPRETGE